MKKFMRHSLKIRKKFEIVEIEFESGGFINYFKQKLMKKVATAFITVSNLDIKVPATRSNISCENYYTILNYF